MIRQTTLPLFIAGEAESPDTEFKSASEGRLPKDIWQTIGAFANTNGGKIIFGIDPFGNTVELSRDQIDTLQQDLFSLCRNKFNVDVTPSMEYSDGILIAYIPPSPAPLRPVYAKAKGMGLGTYVRIGSATTQANSDWVQRLVIAARGGAETLVFDSVVYSEVFSTKLVKQYLSKLNERKNNMYQDFSEEQVLVKLRAIDKQQRPTLFGLLAFGEFESPQEVISPTIKIVVTQYPGPTKVNEYDMRETYVDNREFTGDIKSQFDQAFIFLKSKLPIRGAIDVSGKRQDYLVVPEVVLRETLANALAHRDYGTYASPIQIDIFSDRLEVINPGMSLVPINELDMAPSTSRNPLSMGYLRDYGITDQKARGIRTIKAALREAGLRPPVFENLGQSFRATLSMSTFISTADREWLQNFSTNELNDRQLNALVYVRNNPHGISNSSYRDINSMANVRDDKKANKELRELVDKGILGVLGENKARHYILEDPHV